MLMLFKAQVKGAVQSDLFATTVHVGGYTTKQGTYVPPHEAIRHKHAEHHAAPAHSADNKPVTDNDAKTKPPIPIKADGVEDFIPHPITMREVSGLDIAQSGNEVTVNGRPATMTTADKILDNPKHYLRTVLARAMPRIESGEVMAVVHVDAVNMGAAAPANGKPTYIMIPAENFAAGAPERARFAEWQEELRAKQSERKAAERKYDRKNNEGGEGYNPFRVEGQRSATAVSATLPKDGFAAAVDRAAPAGTAFTADQVAAHWPGHTADEAADHLHADTDHYAVLPGEQWMRMQDYLERGKPADALAQVQEAAAADDMPSHLQDRLGKQAVALADQAVRNATEGMEAPAPAEGEPEESDDPASPHYRYRDTGYVAGSRKELAATVIRRAARSGQQVLPTQIDWADLEANPREAHELITKSNLFGQAPWDALREGGMEPGAGFLIDKVYAAVGKQPSEDSPAARHDYTLGLQSLRTRLESCKTVDEVRTEIENIREEYDGRILTAEQTAQYNALTVEDGELSDKRSILDASSSKTYLIMNSLRSTVDTLNQEIENRKRKKLPSKLGLEASLAEAKGMLNEASSQFAAIRERVNPMLKEIMDRRMTIYRHKQTIVAAAMLRNKLDNPLHRAWTLMGDRFTAVLRYRSAKGSDAFKGHVTAAKSGLVKDWLWADRPGATGPRVTKESVKFQLTVPDNFTRVGGRLMDVQSTAALKANFGLRDVQSGNWVLRDQSSAKWHTEQAAAALADLADVLGVEDGQVSVKGRLALALGARGTGNSGFGGPARAHYEPVQRVINITKMQGGGALAHEWMHALDNMMTEAEVGRPGKVDEWVTENPSLLPPGPMKDAVVNLRAAMFDGPHRESEELAFTAADVKRAQHNLDRYYVNMVGRKIKDAPDVHAAVQAVDQHFTPKDGTKPTRKQKQLNRDWRQIAVAHHGAKAGQPDGGTITVSSGPAISSYALQSARLDDGGTTYWSTTLEMAARAFQSYTEDRLAGMGRRNDYLSALADNRHHDGRPYPEGEERTRINAAFDRLFAAMRQSGTLAKAFALLS